MKTHLSPILAAILIAACSNDSPQPTVAGPITPPANPGGGTFPGSFTIEPQDVVLLPGMVLTLDAAFPTSLLASASVVWTSSDPYIVTVGTAGNCVPALAPGCSRTSAYAHRGGTVLITASMNGLSASSKVYLWGALQFDGQVQADFRILSIGESTNAPLITVSAPVESRGFTVHAVRLFLPSGNSVQFCGVHRFIPPGESVQLFREVYGDYELEFGAKPGIGEAKALVLLTNASGDAGTITVTGPVVNGSMPTTYTGLRIDDPWLPC